MILVTLWSDTMKKFQKIGLILLSAVLLLAGCGESVTLKYELPKTFSKCENGVVDENENYELIWDDVAKCAFLKNKQTGYIWSTTPYDFYMTGETNYSMSSPVVIEYYDTSDNTLQSEKALDVIEQETVSTEIKDKKIYNTFYFENSEITVKLAYYLDNDSLKVSFNSNDLFESGKNKLINVSVTPFFCAIANTDSKSSYLFVPSGSGALMYVDEDLAEGARDYNGEVYGNDPARTQLDNPADEEPVRLPCFGATNGENAILGIVESEEGAAKICASAGTSGRGYSNAYITFNVRGYNNIEWDRGEYKGVEAANDVLLLDDIWPSGKEFTVGYYPLNGENADYNGMAECYREYLKENNLLVESETEQKNYQITLIGGAKTKDFFLGIPYDRFLTVTDFKQTKEIVNDLMEMNQSNPAVVLKGYGEYGIDVSKIAGGFKFASVLGSRKEQKYLEDFCKENNIPIYTDFDLIKFNDSGNGFNTFFDSARTANAETVLCYPKKKNIRTDDTSSGSIKFLSRHSILDAVDKLISFANSNVSGISLSSFGEIAYSDYRDEEFMLKSKYNEQSAKVINSVKNAGHNVFLSAANAYAAGICDGITNTPIQNGGYNVLDEQIPFYQLVYSGSIPLYGTPLNLALNSQKSLLKMVESGVSPSFKIGFEINSALTSNADSEFYGISYKGNKKLIKTTLENTSDYFESIKGSKIKEHKIISEEVTKTVFENGVIVYVNHSSEDITVDGIELKALSFKY